MHYYIYSVVILSLGVVDFGVAIYHRYSGDDHGSVGYAAHIGGGVAGILIGMNVLRNFHHKV
ncbi:MAG TPA: rhomboid family intramembrane serine protease [Dehalococcoidia bacterium]|nr:rhomboid family intramembrane serine protease [Dehalococcoidia bacterium]